MVARVHVSPVSLCTHPRFTTDIELQNLDKEDALICFEERICVLEQKHDEEKEKERRNQKRVQRKHREAFVVLLDELHEQKLLTAMSMWKDLYTVINKYVPCKSCVVLVIQFWQKPIDSSSN